MGKRIGDVQKAIHVEKVRNVRVEGKCSIEKISEFVMVKFVNILPKNIGIKSGSK